MKGVNLGHPIILGMRGSRGGGGSGPPREFAKLNIADITGNEKISYFHILALPQLYVKVGPSWKNFLDPRLLGTKSSKKSMMGLGA